MPGDGFLSLGTQTGVIKLTMAGDQIWMIEFYQLHDITPHPYLIQTPKGIGNSLLSLMPREHYPD